MNIEGQEMETCKILVVPMGNTKITESTQFYPRLPVVKYQAREDSDDKEALKDSVPPSGSIEKMNEDFVAPRADIDKTTKESTKTHKFTNKSTLISLLEPSAPKEMFLESKIPTDVSILSGIGVSVTPERYIPRKKGI